MKTPSSIRGIAITTGTAVAGVAVAAGLNVSGVVGAIDLSDAEPAAATASTATFDPSTDGSDTGDSMVAGARLAWQRQQAVLAAKHAHQVRKDRKARAAKAAKAVAAARTARQAASRSSTRTYSGDPRAIARSMMSSRYGWGAGQFSCLNSLWNRESGWNVHAANPSGAYGIPQAMPGSKMSTKGNDWRDNPATQIAWGLSYIKSSYSDPCGAWSHSQAHGWY